MTLELKTLKAIFSTRQYNFHQNKPDIFFYYNWRILWDKEDLHSQIDGLAMELSNLSCTNPSKCLGLTVVSYGTVATCIQTHWTLVLKWIRYILDLRLHKAYPGQFSIYILRIFIMKHYLSPKMKVILSRLRWVKKHKLKPNDGPELATLGWPCARTSPVSTCFCDKVICPLCHKTMPALVLANTEIGNSFAPDNTTYLSKQLLHNSSDEKYHSVCVPVICIVSLLMKVNSSEMYLFLDLKVLWSIIRNAEVWKLLKLNRYEFWFHLMGCNKDKWYACQWSKKDT